MRSDWRLSGHYFLVMTGHYEIFLRSTALSSSEHSYERMGENNKKDGQSKIIFLVTERKTNIHLLL